MRGAFPISNGMEIDKRKHALFALNILSFLLTLHVVLPVYINSSYLSIYISERYVGLVYTFCSILSILALIGIDRVLERFGNYRTFFGLLIIEIISLVGIMFANSGAFLIAVFAVNFIALALIGFSLDIFLESLSSDNDTGKTRGQFLTAGNAAWILAALIVSVILSDNHYKIVYAASTILFIPIIFLFRLNFKKFKDRPYRTESYWRSFAYAMRKKNIRSVLFVGFLLQFFYAWMVIYTPLYLHNHVGFSWNVIGIIFSVMLLPFVITELPLGKLADTKWGEKEMLCIGFIIMALTTAYISFIDSKNVLLWMAILFLTRVGASVVEIMSETYFFKKIGPEDVGLISIFRSARPLAYIVSPILATVLLAFVDIKLMFVALGVILFLGLGSSLSLEDTK